jgi:hypothetical protein
LADKLSFVALGTSLPTDARGNGVLVAVAVMALGVELVVLYGDAQDQRARRVGALLSAFLGALLGVLLGDLGILVGVLVVVPVSALVGVPLGDLLGNLRCARLDALLLFLGDRVFMPVETEWVVLHEVSVLDRKGVVGTRTASQFLVLYDAAQEVRSVGLLHDVIAALNLAYDVIEGLERSNPAGLVRLSRLPSEPAAVS